MSFVFKFLYNPGMTNERKLGGEQRNNIIRNIRRKGVKKIGNRQRDRDSLAPEPLSICEEERQRLEGE